MATQAAVPNHDNMDEGIKAPNRIAAATATVTTASAAVAAAAAAAATTSNTTFYAAKSEDTLDQTEEGKTQNEEEQQEEQCQQQKGKENERVVQGPGGEIQAEMIDSSAFCRVCRDKSTPENPLFHPCLCRGSIRYVHQQCLIKWLAHSKKTTCELCAHEFRFDPVFAEHMPSQLPISEVIIGAARATYATACDWGRFILVVICWALVLPVLARWTLWTLFDSWGGGGGDGGSSSSGSVDDGASNGSATATWTAVLQGLAWDWLEGVFGGSCIFVLFLSLLGLRDFIVVNDLAIADVSLYYEYAFPLFPPSLPQ